MKKRILHILNSRSYSGAENVVFSIIEHLSEYEFAYVSRKGDIQKRLEAHGIQYYLLDKLTVNEIKRCVLDFKPDIIHAHDFTASILSYFIADNISVISHLHSNPPWSKKYNIKSLSYLFTVKRFDKILAVSNAVFSDFILKKTFENKIKIIFNPIDIDRIRRFAKQKCDKSYDIIALGRLSEAKNPKLFVDIVEECIKKKMQIKAVMIGDGELYNDIKSYINEKHMERYIDMLGFRENPYTYLHNSKILCIPSLWEGFGMAAIEALILGKPVLSSNAGGLSSIINDLCGKVCYSKDEYVNEIIKLILDEEYYQKKSENATKRAEKMQKKIDYYNSLRQIYQELL